MIKIEQNPTPDFYTEVGQIIKYTNLLKEAGITVVFKTGAMFLDFQDDKSGVDLETPFYNARELKSYWLGLQDGAFSTNQDKIKSSIRVMENPW